MEYAGDVKVWRANSNSGNIGEYPPIGRRDPDGAGIYFEDGDWFTPASVKLNVFYHPVNRPHGTYFKFEEALFEALFRAAIDKNGSIFKMV